MNSQPIPLRAEILAIGDEITSGQLLDTNSQWLSQRLEDLGVRVLYHTTVGDDLDACVEVFCQAIGRADLLIATGGLGPTADDLTRQAMADAVGRELVLDPGALEHIRGLFARRKREMPKQNEVQALFPAGSRVIPNPHGTAPGIDLDAPRPGGGTCRMFALPGVPAEMVEMWHGYLAEALRAAGAGQRVILRRNIKCFGAGESHIEAMLPDIIRRGRTPTVGINASKATIILRIAAEGRNEEECRRLIEPTAAVIYQSLGKLVFGEGDDELQDVVIRLLAERNRTLATAEIGTAGLVAQWLDGAGAGQGGYLGGLVARGETALQQILGIPPELLAGFGPASAEVAQAMAVECRRRFGADYGLAVGGFPRSDENPAAAGGATSQVVLALAGLDGVEVKQIPFAIHPSLIEIYFAKQALNLVRLTLSKSPLPVGEG